MLALSGCLMYRWWQQRHSDDEYPFLTRKTYPAPVRPPPAPLLPVPDPPPVFRVVLCDATNPPRPAAHSIASVACSILSLLLPSSASCQTALEGVEPPQWRGWPHEGPASALDTASLRRGFEVYRQVCSACHSLQWLRFRQLVGVTHTEEQAKALARSALVLDGPDEEGKIFERPGTLADAFPPPYPNEQFARFVNNGASDTRTYQRRLSVSRRSSLLCFSPSLFRLAGTTDVSCIMHVLAAGTACRQTSRSWQTSHIDACTCTPTQNSGSAPARCDSLL